MATKAKAKANVKPLVGILMGSTSDWETMQHTARTLEKLGVPYEAQAISAHRAPDELTSYVKSAERNGVQLFIAAAGLAAHLPGVVAAKTALPVLGVPMDGGPLKGMDALLSIVQMPPGVPVGSLAIGKPGAINAALLATTILGTKSVKYRNAYKRFRAAQTKKAVANKKLSL